jgi:hypothetical protein
MIRHDNGAINFQIAASGTADAAISFTQAMTLDAGGNLLVGSTATPSSGSSTILAANATGGGLQIAHVNSGGGSLFVGLAGGGVATYTYTGAVGSESYTERARISSDGTFRVKGAGTAGSTDAFQVAGTAPASAMVLNSSGNLLVGTTGSGVVGCILEPVGRVQGTTGLVGTACFQNWNQATSGDNVFQQFYTEGGGGTLRGSIEFNRTAGLVAYNTTSDYRAKDIYGPVIGSGALIDSVPVYMGKMKGATQERPMFIAHEVPAYAHTGEKDAVDADGKPVYQQMDASALIPVMWAEIQDLRKRLAAAGI